MKRTILIKVIIDLSMIPLLISAYAYRITGNIAHEFTGVSIFILFIVHHIINKQWYKVIFKGKYNKQRILITSVNVLLLLIIFTLLLSGLCNSRVLLGSLHLEGSMMLRQIHTTAAYWLLIVVSLHVGLYWNIFINSMRRITGITNTRFAVKLLSRIFLLLLIIIGMWSFIERDIASKLFHGFAFDFWDEEKPDILFFIETISIMSIFIFAGYLIKKIHIHRKGGEKKIIKFFIRVESGNFKEKRIFTEI